MSGLAVNDKRSLLYQLETIPGRFGIVVYDIGNPLASGFKPIAKCIGLTSTKTGLAGGLAYDELRDQLLIGISETLPTGGYAHYIVISSVKSPCKALCRYQVSNTCLNNKRVISGLAYDCCPQRMLYVTDGVSNLELLAIGSATSPCSFKVQRCCASSGPYRGLAVIPGWRVAHVGKSCLGNPCASCPDMYMGTSGGDPSLGSQTFSLDLINAPRGSIGGLILKGGTCCSGIPVFCGSLYAVPFGLGPLIVVTSGTGCSAFGRFTLGIPPMRALCGVTICAQYAIFCPSAAGPHGFGLSNALQFNIAAS